MILLVVSLLGALAIVWVAAPVRAWWLHRDARYDEEIVWLEGVQPLLPAAPSTLRSIGSIASASSAS